MEERSPKNVPIPDPSLLTTEQLDREIAHLTSLLDQRITAERTLTDEQLASRDRAITAALTAAQETISKDSATATKQLEVVEKVTQTEISSLKHQVNEMKAAHAALQLQVSGIEQRTGGATAAAKESRANITSFVAIAISLIGVVIVAILGFST